MLRLREKGAWLRGFGQYGKTGDGVIQIYDQFNELAHGTSRSGRDAAPAKAPSAGRAAAGGGRGSRRGGRGRWGWCGVGGIGLVTTLDARKNE